MPDPSRLALFVGAALLLLVVPGPSVLYIVTQSVSHGRRAGIASVAGITTGTLVHIAAATVGLSACSHPQQSPSTSSSTSARPT